MKTKTDKIKIAVIGFGKMGHFHFNALKSLLSGEFENYYKADAAELLSRIEICGICDVRKELIDSVDCFSDYKKFFELKKPDIAVIATPTETHFEIAQAALRSGINVFVEKPIVQTSRQFDMLLEIADAKGLKIMAGHIERYNPVSIKLREVLLDNTANAAFSFERIQQHSERIKDDIIVDKLIHDLDLSMFLFGDIRSYEILNFVKKDGKVQEIKIKVEHLSNSGEIFVSWLKGDIVRRTVMIYQNDDLIEGDFLNKKLLCNGRDIECRVPKWIESQNNQIKDELVDFIVHCFSCKPDLPPPLLSIGEIEKSVKIIEEIEKHCLS